MIRTRTQDLNEKNIHNIKIYAKSLKPALKRYTEIQFDYSCFETGYIKKSCSDCEEEITVRQNVKRKAAFPEFENMS